MSSHTPHRTVLLEEAVAALEIKASGAYVDATFGRGGHSRAILERLGPQGRLLALDRFDKVQPLQLAQELHCLRHLLRGTTVVGADGHARQRDGA